VRGKPPGLARPHSLYLADSQPLLTALSTASELSEGKRMKRVETDVPLWRLYRDYLCRITKERRR